MIIYIYMHLSNSYSFVKFCCDSMIFREGERERERERCHIPEVSAQDFKTSYDCQGHGFFSFSQMDAPGHELRVSVCLST